MRTGAITGTYCSSCADGISLQLPMLLLFRFVLGSTHFVTSEYEERYREVKKADSMIGRYIDYKQKQSDELPIRAKFDPPSKSFFCALSHQSPDFLTVCFDVVTDFFLLGLTR